MAPHKAKSRANYPQPLPQISDYETDAPPPNLEVPLPPPRSNEELNFSVLRRVYPDLTAIEHVTPFAALYTFTLDGQGEGRWEKVGLEGSLFICQLAPTAIGVERYCVIIHNRKGLNNFSLDLTDSDEIEVAEPYVILQGNDTIYGLWIFADPPPASTANCRVETVNKMMGIAAKAKASREAIEREADNGTQATTSQVVGVVSTPMGRQLSIRDLFGHHSQGPHTSNQPPRDTFCPQPYMLEQESGLDQPDVLGQLFMKAKQDYNGHG